MTTTSTEHIHSEVLAKLSPLIVSTLTHWKIANVMLPAQFPVVLFSDTTLEATESLADTLISLHEEANQLSVASELVTGELKEKQWALREWLRFYSRMVRGHAAGTKWERLLARLPQKNGAPILTQDAATQVAIFWENLEASPPMGWPGPMVRSDGSGLAEFRAEVRAFSEAMAAALEARIAAEHAEIYVAWTREQLAEICLRYPAAVKSRFRTGHGLLDSVPKPWPQEKKAARSA